MPNRAGDTAAERKVTMCDVSVWGIDQHRSDFADDGRRTQDVRGEAYDADLQDEARQSDDHVRPELLGHCPIVISKISVLIEQEMSGGRDDDRSRRRNLDGDTELYEQQKQPDVGELCEAADRKVPEHDERGTSVV